MLTIRLQRAGKKNKPEYRLVLAEKASAAKKKITEILGNYNPHTKAFSVKDPARLDYWIKEQHVEVSPTAYNLLITNKLVEGVKVKAFTLPKKEVVAEEAPTETPIEEAPKAEEAPASETAPTETPSK
ncbi:MAG: 30S ribosomal protein S16, partial [bacterium]|nr:30S ribosomal protein S16 [bacterium]